MLGIRNAIPFIKTFRRGNKAAPFSIGPDSILIQQLLAKGVQEGNVIPDTYNKGTVRPATTGIAPDFNGTTGYIEIPHSPLLTFGDGAGNDDPFTIMARINMDDATRFRLFVKIGATDYDYALNSNVSDQLQFTLATNGSSANHIGRQTPALTSYQGQDLYIIATYDGSKLASGIKIYVYDSTSTLLEVDDTDANAGTYNGMASGTLPQRIGEINAFYSNGRQWDTRVLDHVATQAEIDEYVGICHPEKEIAGTIEHWKLDENGGKTAYGCVNNLHGEYFNITWVTQNNISFQNEQGYSVGASYELSATAGSYVNEGSNWVTEITYDNDFTLELDFITPNVLPTGNEVLFICKLANGYRFGFQWTSNRLTCGIYTGSTKIGGGTILNSLLTGNTFYKLTAIWDATGVVFTTLTLNEIAFNTADDQQPLGATPNRFVLGIGNNLTSQPLTSIGATILRLRVVTPTYGDLTYTAKNQWQDQAPLFTDNSTVSYPRLPALSGSTIVGHAGNSLDYKGIASKNALAINNHCATFDGVADEINIPHNVNQQFDESNTWSFSTWFSVQGTTNAINFMKKGVNWFFQLTGTGGLRFNHNGINTTVLTNAALVNGNVYFVVFRYNGNSNYNGIEARVYDSDLNLFDSGFASSGAMDITVSTDAIEIAVNTSANSQATYWNMRLFIDKQLTNDEILQVASGNIVGNEVIALPMAEGKGNITFDVSGNNQHGTITATSLTTFWASTQDNYAHNLKYGFGVGLMRLNATDDNDVVRQDPIANGGFTSGENWIEIEFLPVTAGGSIEGLYQHRLRSSELGGWWIYIDNSNDLKLDVGDTVSYSTITWAGTINRYQWNRVRIEYNATTDVWAATINGVLQGTTLTKDMIPSSRSKHSIGAFESTTGNNFANYFIGVIKNLVYHSGATGETGTYPLIETGGVFPSLEDAADTFSYLVAGVNHAEAVKVPIPNYDGSLDNPAGAWYNGAESDIQLNPDLDPRLYRAGITDGVFYSLDVENPIYPSLVNNLNPIKQKDLLTYCELTAAQIEAVEQWLGIDDNILIRQGAIADWDFGDGTKFLNSSTSVYGVLDKASNYSFLSNSYTSNFSAGVDSWQVLNGAIAGNIDGIGGENDCLRTTADATSGLHYASRNNVLVVGRVSRIRFKFFIPSANAVIKGISLRMTGANIDISEATFTNALTDQWIQVDVYATGTNDVLGAGVVGRILGTNSVGGISFGGANGDIFYIKDFIVDNVDAKALAATGTTTNPEHIDTDSDSILDALEFDGIDEWVGTVDNIADIIALTQGEIFLVVNTGAAAVRRVFFSVGDKDDDLDKITFERHSDNTYRMVITIAGTTNTVVFGSVTANEWIVLSFRSDGTSYKCYVNGVESAYASGTDNGNFFGDLNAPDQIALGKIAQSTPVYSAFNMRGGPTIFPTVQDAERANIIKYLKARHLVP